METPTRGGPGRGQGRKPKSDSGEHLKTRAMRWTDAGWADAQYIGMDKVRELVTKEAAKQRKDCAARIAAQVASATELAQQLIAAGVPVLSIEPPDRPGVSVALHLGGGVYVNAAPGARANVSRAFNAGTPGASFVIYDEREEGQIAELLADIANIRAEAA